MDWTWIIKLDYDEEFKTLFEAGIIKSGLNLLNIYEGNFSCHAPGQKAWFDSWFSCIIFQIPFYVEAFQLGYLCYPLIASIILISIFGEIKENYRWFILNQAIWDCFVSYNFLCSRPAYVQWFKRYSRHSDSTQFFKDIHQTPPSCFYSPSENHYSSTGFSTIPDTLLQGIITAATYSSYAPLFLLTFSRFLSIYFHYFHEKFNSTFRVSLLIIFFNIFCVITTNMVEWARLIQDHILENLYEECMKTCPNGCPSNRCMQWSGRNPFPAFQYIQIGIPPFLLLLSSILAAMVVIKIFKQIKFQYKTNQKSLSTNLRIALVISFQCFTMTFLMFASTAQEYIWIYINGDNKNGAYIKSEQFVTANFLSWFKLLSLPVSVQSFTVIRIFLDSIITLTILGEYRKCVKMSVKFVVQCFVNPLKTFKKVKSHFFKNSINAIPTQNLFSRRPNINHNNNVSAIISSAAN